MQAYGFFRYISDGFNVFDGVIVMFSCLEIYKSLVYGLGEGGDNSGISVLRTFRLLREEGSRVLFFFSNFSRSQSITIKRNT